MGLEVSCEAVQNGVMTTSRKKSVAPSQPRINARCSPQEWEAVEEAAAAVGLKRSDFIVQQMRQACESILRALNKPVPFLKEEKGKTDERTSRRRRPKA